MSSTLSHLRSSPIPDLAYDSYRSLGLREKTIIKRQINSNNNFEQQNQQNIHDLNFRDQPAPLGESFREHSTSTPTTMQRRYSSKGLSAQRPVSYVSVNGGAYSLDKYAGESMAFWILLVLLAILVMGNAILTFVIYGVLRLGAGMESIEFLQRSLKFYGSADLDDLYKHDGLLQGFKDRPVEFIGEEGQVHFQVQDGSQPSLSVGKNVINITQINEFRVVDKKGRNVFSTNLPTLGLPRGVQKLDVRVAKANRITSSVNASLEFASTSYTYLRGSEGIHMNGKQMVWKADQDITLKSVNGNLYLSGKEGIILNVNDLPLVRESGVTRKSHTYTTQGKKEPQFQLCICMPEGKLFKVEIPLNNHIRPQHQRVGCHSAYNPC